MIEKRPIHPERIRQINGSFAFIEHKFLREGFFECLSHVETALYLFLILVSDRKGLSYYSYDKICTIMGICLDDYILTRNSLIEKDLIAFDGTLFQVLDLPEKMSIPQMKALRSRKDMETHDPATIRKLIRDTLGGSDG